jgi:hypothetical protein
MRPVAAGQWTDLEGSYTIDYEVGRADRVEAEFRQGDIAVIEQVTGFGGLHVRVPSEVSPGAVLVRTRTWIEQTTSEWSRATAFRVLTHRVPVSIDSIDSGPSRTRVWWSGTDAPTYALVQRGDALVLFGHFPVTNAGDVRVRFKGKSRTYELTPTNIESGIRVELPGAIAPGEWRLVVDTKDGSTSPVEIKMRVG